MFGDRRDKACWGGCAALLALLGAPTEGLAASDVVRAGTGTYEVSFGAQDADVRFCFYRFETPPTPATAAIDPPANDFGLTLPDDAEAFSYVSSALDAARPPSRDLAIATMTPVPEPSSLMLLLAGIGLFVVRGTAIWRQDHRRSGERV